MGRCGTGSLLNASEFTIGLPTPRQPNSCPLETFSHKISFKLIDAVCSQFKAHMLVLGIDYIVTNVNSRCRCGFTYANVKSYSFTCGSVVLHATLYGSSKRQIDIIWKYYKEFVKNTPVAAFANSNFSVDTSCIENSCIPVKPGDKGHSPNVTVAVVVSCVVVFLIIVLVVVLYMKRKRRGIAHFRMARFDAEDETLTGDMDDFVAGEQASFNNPLYFRT